MENLQTNPVTLKSFINLLEETWSLYKTRIRTLSTIAALPVIFSLFFLFLIDFLGGTDLRYSVIFSIIQFIFLSGSFMLSLWIIPSLILSIKNNTGAADSLKEGLKFIVSYFWIYFLLNIIVIGGLFFFIIPVILFSIWFSLAFYILVFEEKKGLSALMASRELVSGNFLGLFWRFLVFGLIIATISFLIFFIPAFIIAFPLSFIFGNLEQVMQFGGSIIGSLNQLFILPLSLIFGFLIYENLKEIKKDIVYREITALRKIKYLIPGFLGLLVVIAVVFFLSLNIFLGRDEPPFDDSDLWLPKVEISQSDNAFYYFEDIREKIYIPYNIEENKLFQDMSNGQAWDAEFAKELIDKNQQAFESFNKAFDCPVYQQPSLIDPKEFSINTIIYSVGYLRNIAQLSCVKATYLFKEDKQQEAFEQIIKNLELSQMLKNAPLPQLIDGLVSLTIDDISLKNLRLMIPETNLSSSALKEQINKLDEFKGNNDWIKTSFKLEYIKQQNAYRELANYSSYFYKPNQTKRMFAEHYQGMIRNAEQDYYKDMESFEFNPLYLENFSIETLFKGNLIGKIFYDMIAVNQEGLLVNNYLNEFSFSGTQVLMALKAYQIDNAKLPNSLDELVPEYLSQVPKDPFDGQAIRFSPEKRIIYSVGQDLIDSGGSQGDDLYSMPDPTLKIEF